MHPLSLVDATLEHTLARDETAMTEAVASLHGVGLSPLDSALGFLDPRLVEAGRRGALAEVTIVQEHTVAARGTCLLDDVIRETTRHLRQLRGSVMSPPLHERMLPARSRHE